jgi:DnaJ-class molecular chaperone
VLDGDYFALLGVSRTATTYEIRRAFESMSADFAPERFELLVRAELAGMLAEIRAVLDDAWRALGDDRLREAYRAHLAG